MITLGIIGVVAALTMPSIVENYQKQEALARLKKAYTNINQAFRLSVQENGEMEYWDDIDSIGSVNYINKYWAKYFNHIVICYTYSQCGFSEMHPYKFRNNEDSTYTVAVSNRRIAFLTADGIMYTINFAGGPDGALVKSSGVYIDINGPKGPNIFGKDFFSFLLIEGKGVLPEGYNSSTFLINTGCSFNNKGHTCAAKIIRDGWQIADDYPW